MTTTRNRFIGVDLDDLAHVLARGVDHGGNTVVPFRDPDGGWPLRCCLRRSRAGEELAIVAWSPFDWDGPYRETGPIVVHAGLDAQGRPTCEGTPRDLAELPAELDGSPMVLRPYRHDHVIAYHHVRHVPGGGSLSAHVAELLALDDVAFVHGRNVTGGCFAFAAYRADAPNRSPERVLA